MLSKRALPGLQEGIRCKADNDATNTDQDGAQLAYEFPTANGAMGNTGSTYGTGDYTGITAYEHGLAYNGPDSLYEPSLNIALGSAYRREMEAKYGATYQAIAAYNAGPTPVARWLAQRPSHDPDLWIETITYKETRDYVARVLAFSVIYDWRLNGDALPVSQRLLGITQGRRKGFACPDPEP